MSDRISSSRHRPGSPTAVERAERYAARVDVVRVARAEAIGNAPKTRLETERRTAARLVQIERSRSSGGDHTGG